MGLLLFQRVLHQFLAQGRTVNPEPFAGQTLVAIGFVHHQLKQWFFTSGQQHLVQIMRLCAQRIIEGAEVDVEVMLNAGADVDHVIVGDFGVDELKAAGVHVCVFLFELL